MKKIVGVTLGCLTLTLTSIGVAVADTRPSDAEFRACIFMAGVKDESVEGGYYYDFRKVRENRICESVIEYYSSAKPLDDVSQEIRKKVREAVQEGRAPQIVSNVIKVGELKEARPAQDLSGATVLYENDDIQILMIQKK